MTICIKHLKTPIQTVTDLFHQDFIWKPKGLISWDVKIRLVKKKNIKSKNSYQIACEYKINISESVLSDISYSRVEDSLDSDSNFEDALKRREQELVGTVKRKRISGGLSDPNVLRKEIEVTLFFVPKKETI